MTTTTAATTTMIIITISRRTVVIGVCIYINVSAMFFPDVRLAVTKV